jgi:hypothetical protein
LKSTARSYLLTTALATLALLTSLGSRNATAQLYNPQDGEPPPGVHQRFTDTEWTLKPTPDGVRLRGTARLDCFTDFKDEMIVMLEGGKPKEVYSLWVVRKDGDLVERAQLFTAWDGPRAKEGKIEFQGDGKSFYRGVFTQCPLGVWKTLEVRYHPDGKFTSLNNSVVVLTAKMKG